MWLHLRGTTVKIDSLTSIRPIQCAIVGKNGDSMTIDACQISYFYVHWILGLFGHCLNLKENNKWRWLYICVFCLFTLQPIHVCMKRLMDTQGWANTYIHQCRDLYVYLYRCWSQKSGGLLSLALDIHPQSPFRPVPTGQCIRLGQERQ